MVWVGFITNLGIYLMPNPIYILNILSNNSIEPHFVLFQAIQFSIIVCTKFKCQTLFLPLDRTLRRCYFWLEWTRERWHFPSIQHYWSLAVRLFRVISGHSLCREDLRLCRDAFGVFYSPNWLVWKIFEFKRNVYDITDITFHLHNHAVTGYISRNFCCEISQKKKKKKKKNQRVICRSSTKTIHVTYSPYFSCTAETARTNYRALGSRRVCDWSTLGTVKLGEVIWKRGSLSHCYIFVS